MQDSLLFTDPRGRLQARFPGRRRCGRGGRGWRGAFSKDNGGVVRAGEDAIGHEDVDMDKASHLTPLPPPRWHRSRLPAGWPVGGDEPPFPGSHRGCAGRDRREVQHPDRSGVDIDGVRCQSGAGGCRAHEDHDAADLLRYLGVHPGDRRRSHGVDRDDLCPHPGRRRYRVRGRVQHRRHLAAAGTAGHRAESARRGREQAPPGGEHSHAGGEPARPVDAAHPHRRERGGHAAHRRREQRARGRSSRSCSRGW